MVLALGSPKLMDHPTAAVSLDVASSANNGSHRRYVSSFCTALSKPCPCTFLHVSLAYQIQILSQDHNTPSVSAARSQPQLNTRNLLSSVSYFVQRRYVPLKSCYTVRMIVQASDTGLDSHRFSQTGRPAAANIAFDFPTRTTPV